MVKKNRTDSESSAAPRSAGMKPVVNAAGRCSPGPRKTGHPADNNTQVHRAEPPMKNAPLRSAGGKQKEKLRTGMSLEDILESMSDGLLCLDRDMVVIYFNAAAERLLKRRREDILGRRLFDVFPEAKGSVFEDEYTRALRDKKFVSFETYFGVKPYEDWYDVKVHPSEEGLTVFFQVITRRKQSEQRIEELNRSLQRRLSELETIFETAPVGIAIAEDPEGRHIRGNPANERLLGLPRGGELSMRAPKGSAPAYRVLKGDRPLAVDELPMQRAVRGEMVTGDAFSFIRTDGSVVELLCNATPLLDEEGRPRGAIGSFQDITDLRRVEEELRQSRERLAWVLGVTGVGTWLNEMPLGRLNWDEKTKQLFCVPAGTEPTIDLFWSRLHPDDREPTRLAVEKAVRERSLYEIDHRVVNPFTGEVRWVRSAGQATYGADGAPVRFDGINYDITERKRGEEALRESEENLRKAREALQEANEELECRIKQRTEELRRAYRDLEKKTYDLNERVKELNCLNTVHRLLSGEGVSMASALYEVVNVIPSGWQFPETTGACVTLSGLEFKTVNYRDTPWKLQRPIRIRGAVQGSLSVVYCTERPAIDAGPFMKEEDALIGTLADLIGDFLERMRNRSMLEESGARYRRVSQQFQALLDAIPDVLVLVFADMRILWANRAATAQMGTTSENLEGRTCDDLWAVLAGGGDSCPARACFRSGQQTAARFGTLGNTSWDIKVIPVKDEDGTVVNVIIDARDITGELRLQEEAVRSARLASLGELAAGVAHEINNPINSIINYAQILANRADPPSREHEFAEEIVNEGGRIAGIVKGLLGFARDRSDVKHPVTLQNILEATFVLTNAQLRRDGIKLRVIMPQDLPPIRANQQQIQQVFLNLISNARYALNKKYHGPHQDKTLDIRGESCTVDGKPHVRIEVCDHGSGIPKNIQHKVISPFFTTKPPSEGTGLGLSISHGIVADHGGRLTLESVEGEYTTVMIDLPAEAPEEAP